jgi:hypothetical protein
MTKNTPETNLGIPGSEISRPQDRITWGSQISIGLDRLKYGLHVEWDSERILDILGAAKQDAKEKRTVIPIDLGGDLDHTYNVHATGRSGGYAFRISKADISIFFSVRKKYMDTPNVWVDIGSSSCWSPGYEAVMHHIEDLIKLFGGKIRKNGVSEVHVCADFIGCEISHLGLHNFDQWITRATKLHAHHDRSKFSGISFDQDFGQLGISDSKYDEVGIAVENGISVGLGDIALRIYDKVLEMKRQHSKQSVFASVWGKDEYNEESVTRVEFQLRRPVLRQLRVNTLDDLFQKVGGIWEYCTSNWSRFCSQPVDKKNRHQDRAEIHPWWVQVQELAHEWDSYQSISRQKLLPQKDKKQLMDMAGGCLMNVAAIYRLKPDDIDYFTNRMISLMDTWLRTNKEDINEKTGKSVLEEKINKKWNEVWPFGLQEVHGYPDHMRE